MNFILTYLAVLVVIGVILGLVWLAAALHVVAFVLLFALFITVGIIFMSS